MYCIAIQYRYVIYVICNIIPIATRITFIFKKRIKTTKGLSCMIDLGPNSMKINYIIKLFALGKLCLS